MSTQTLASHEHALEYFRRAREKSRLSHAYLLVGAPGSGKIRFSLDFCRWSDDALASWWRSASGNILDCILLYFDGCRLIVWQFLS